MIDDLYKMGDKDFMKKWNTSRQYPIRNRKKLGIPPFNIQHGTIPHKFKNGAEYKYCPKEDGHWVSVSGFNASLTRYDGLAGVCREHQKQYAKKRYLNGGAEKDKAWKKTENGKKYLRRTWRRKSATKKNAYVKWNREDEERAYRVFNGLCAYCSTRVPFLELEFDHFIPIALGGKTEPKNMVPCCKRCNHGAGGKFKREPKEWMAERFGDRWVWIYRDIKEKIRRIENE